MERLKRIAAIHDVSGVGKCSLTAVLPIISAAGVECSVMPTAVLSTHTGEFRNFTFRDLTEDMRPMAEHWLSEGIGFDALYSGYLGSPGQIEIVRDIFATFKKRDTLVMVDPAMADNGRLYSLVKPGHVSGMAKLCGCADLIIPNRTEAAFMLGREYREGPVAKNEVERLLLELSDLGAKKVVLTGVCLKDDEIGVACYDAKDGSVEYIMDARIRGIYHGTGDVFGAFLLGALMRGRVLPEAARIAVKCTCAAIRLTAEDGAETKMGVRFENVLASYGRMCGESAELVRI